MFACFGLQCEQKLISNVLFIKCIQLSTKDNQSHFFWGEENRRRRLKSYFTGETHKAERKMFGFLIICGKHDSWGGSERFLSNRMKNRAVGPASVISLYLPGFRCVSASFFLHLTISPFHTGSLAFLTDSDSQRKCVSYRYI